MKLTNKQMDEYANALSNLMEKTQGKLGYAIAKNFRLMTNELKEYIGLKDSAINKLGEQDEDGRIRIRIGTDAHKQYLEEMKQYDDIESDVNLVMVKPDDVYSSNLNAMEISGILFMVDETEETDE